MITDRQKADCAEREVKQRQRVYPRLIADKRMSPTFASQQLTLMEAIAADYRMKADAHDASERLL